MYFLATSLAISMATQKYGGDSTHPIWSEVGITICIGSSSSCGRTYAKLYSSPSVQSRHQKPSLMSHFAINIFAVSSVSEMHVLFVTSNPQSGQSPLLVLFFSIVSLTDASTPPFFSLSQKDNSRIKQNAFDLCGIAAIGEISNSLGGLSLILSHATMRAWLVCTFSATSSAKCAMASGMSADW